MVFPLPLLFSYLVYHKFTSHPIESHHVPELAIREPFIKSASPISIHASSFEHLVQQGTIFIDRSLLIKQIFDYDSHVLIITMPNGFGKTMNLGMIQAFFEIQFDNEGNTIEPRNQTTHYRLFKHGEIIHRKKNNETLKNPLLIATKHENFTDFYLGTLPVVYINFGTIKGDNFDEVVSDVRLKISQVYEEFYHLLVAFRTVLNDPASTSDQKARAEYKIDVFKKHAFKRSTLEESMDSLGFLCNALYEHYQKKAILLVDDYDAILNHTLFSDKFYSSRDEDLIIEFFKGFVTSCVAYENATEKVIFSGALLLKQDALMPALNNSKEFSIWDNELSSFYACQDNFTDKILEQIGVKELPRNMLRAVRLGYRLNLQSQQLSYDPLTIACNSGACLVPRTYATYFHKFLDVVSFRNAFHGLVSNSMIPDLNFSRVQFDRNDFRIMKIPSKNETDCGAFIQSAMKYLYATGFLTISNCSTPGNIWFKFPNEAILVLMKGELLAYYDKGFKVQSDILHTYLSLISFQFYDFSRSFAHNCTNLESLMTKFYTILLDPARNSSPNEETIHNSINFLTIFFDKFKRLVTYGPEIVLFTNDYVLMILETTFNEESADRALKLAKNRSQSFRKHDNFNMFKFVGINVRQNGTVHILGENIFYRELFESSKELRN